MKTKQQNSSIIKHILPHFLPGFKGGERGWNGGGPRHEGGFHRGRSEEKQGETGGKMGVERGEKKKRGG